MDSDFKYPPGVLPVSHWTARFVQFKESFGAFVRAVQQDAILAERKSNAATLVRWNTQNLDEQLTARFGEICKSVTLEELAANNAAWKAGYNVT